MSAKIYSNRYNHIYNANLVEMAKDYNNSCAQYSNAEYDVAILAKSDVEYVHLDDDEKLVYTDDWFVILKPFGDFIWVNALYVKPDCRRTGLGTFVIKHLVRSYEKVFLGCNENSNEAIAFYKSFDPKENVSCVRGIKTFVFESC